MQHDAAGEPFILQGQQIACLIHFLAAFWQPAMVWPHSPNHRRLPLLSQLLIIRFGKHSNIGNWINENALTLNSENQ